MAVVSFKDVTWGNEQIETAKLNDMAANTRYLFERAPKLLYTAYGAKKDVGLKILSGTATVVATKSNIRYVTIPFGSFFTTGSKPVIVNGIYSPNQVGLVTTMHGISGSAYVPDHRGFVARVAARELSTKSNYIMANCYLHWIAMGY
jgi:hypothetical protein